MDIQNLIRDLKYVDEILGKEDYRPLGHARTTIADAISVIQQLLNKHDVMRGQSPEPLALTSDCCSSEVDVHYSCSKCGEWCNANGA